MHRDCFWKVLNFVIRQQGFLTMIGKLFLVDAEDCDSFNPSPAKRPANSFYSPVSTLSSVSSSSSPDHLSDSNLNRFSCDDDSGNENAFLPSISQQTSLNAITPVNTPLSCDTRTTHSFAFMKPRYIAPQSPLAAGVSSASMVSDTNRKGSVNGQSYSFAPVKDWHKMNQLYQSAVWFQDDDKLIHSMTSKRSWDGWITLRRL